MGRVLPIVVLALLAIYAVVEVAQSDPYRVRMLPRWLWAVAIIMVPAVGPICWLLFGRPTNRPQDPGRRPPRAPDDDPDFLRRL
ncbi:MAG: PLD nuclease N-terminal domain-containing protein [Propionicimonas sp.]|uniref:PLD nuclease N-terminal domain-containing protein n=1 Tax=Propionicimonas sp. TaxID=1955623 RepID=UPI002B201F8A|nr:PLD nuclease N-terminal domain-containing protein [Propionicimonas sp.]MEA4943798.1 PLD nuclease N-terminal domain-containing protein [Propionicimonas sp.]MEA5053579.1 PLD nuclease N-terminal domain-containing protein [Propionicimonas sp.]MEA5117882.1 PLD nuclease N-terminal domain-containing protein [Propionicimonas sp.]